MLDDNSLVAQSNTAVALGEQARAVIEARFVVAMKRPRDLEYSREKLVKECNRPGFSAVAIFKKPIGGGKFVEGPSIRFAEAAIRCMGNIIVDTMAISDEVEKKVLRVSVSDIENNTSFSQEVIILKTVERSRPADDGTYISVRKNSAGKNVYLLPADEEQLINKTNSAISKAVRNLAIRLVPGDIVDDCMQECRDTLRKTKIEIPKMVAAFEKLGVPKAELEAYLEKEISTITADEAIDIRGIYTSIKDGEATWKEIFEQKKPASKIAPLKEKEGGN